MAAGDKTSVKYELLCNSDCFAFIAFSPHSVLLTNYAKTGLVVASCNKIYGMKDLLLGLYVIVQTLNLETSRSVWQTSQRILRKCVPHVQHDYFSLFIQSDHFFPALSLSLPLPLRKLPIALATSFPGSLFFPSFFLPL